MRLGALDERAVLLHADQAVDIAVASAGRFGPHPMQLYAHWDEFREWERNAEVSTARRPLRERDLTCPVREPGPIIAVGLNYAGHAAETRYEVSQRDGWDHVAGLTIGQDLSL